MQSDKRTLFYIHLPGHGYFKRMATVAGYPQAEFTFSTALAKAYKTRTGALRMARRIDRNAEIIAIEWV